MRVSELELIVHIKFLILLIGFRDFLSRDYFDAFIFLNRLLLCLGFLSDLAFVCGGKRALACSHSLSASFPLHYLTARHGPVLRFL